MKVKGFTKKALKDFRDTIKPTCMGNVWKIEMIDQVLEIKLPAKSKLSRVIYDMFIVSCIDTETTMINHKEPSKTQITKIKSICNAKTEKTEAKRILNYISYEFNKYLFKYEHKDNMAEITKLWDKCTAIVGA